MNTVSKPIVYKRVFPAQLEGRWLLGARLAWLSLYVALVAIVAGGFFRVFQNPELVVLEPVVDILDRLPLSHAATITIALVIPTSVVFAICLFVFVRSSSDPMALVFSAQLVTLYAYTSRTLLTYEDVAVLEHALSFTFAVGSVLLALVLAVFPNGSAVPTWSLWLAAPTVAVFSLVPNLGAVLMAAVDGPIDSTLRTQIGFLSWSSMFGIGLGCQIYRYRRVSSLTEQLQAKWVFAPLGLFFVVLIITMSVFILFPETAGPWLGGVVILTIPLAILFPLGVANAVLRHRLYEIDRVISRTVTYGVVITVLGLVYAALVLGVGSLLSNTTQVENDLMISLSVVLVVILFRPLRNRVQDAVGRRFNRTHYEHQVVLDEFTTRTRKLASVEDLAADLEETASDAFGPSGIGVWTRP